MEDFKVIDRGVHPTRYDYCGSKCITMGTIRKLSAKVNELKEVKIKRMEKEVILRKRVTLLLEEICTAAHIIVGQGSLDPSHLLWRIDTKISEVKEETLCRKEILEKVNKWFAACEEECWLEEYNRMTIATMLEEVPISC